MKKVIYLFVAMLCTLTTNAQQSQDLNLDYSSGRSMSEFFSILRKKSIAGTGIGFQKASFFNTLYYNSATGKDNMIENKGGFDVTFFYHACPVLFDFGFFSSSFKVNSGSYYPDIPKKTTLLQGLDVYISYAPLLPDYGKISEIITPYIGIGYQTSSLVVRDSDKDKDKTVASLGTSSPMWKGGLKINLKKFFIRCEYKQSLSLSKSTSFNAFSISAGIQR